MRALLQRVTEAEVRLRVKNRVDRCRPADPDLRHG